MNEEKTDPARYMLDIWRGFHQVFHPNRSLLDFSARRKTVFAKTKRLKNDSVRNIFLSELLEWGKLPRSVASESYLLEQESR